MSSNQEGDIMVSSMSTSPNKDTYTRRTASLNAEAALKCLTEASRRMSPSTRAFYSRKRTQDNDGMDDLPNVGKLTPTSTCADSSAVRSLRFTVQDSASSTKRSHRKNSKSKELQQQHAKVKAKPFITKTITLPQDFFVRRTANLNASACMTALLSPTKKAKIEESNSGQNYAVIVPAQEDVEVDVVEVDVDPVPNEIYTQNTNNKVESKVNELTTIASKPKVTTKERSLSMYKGLDLPPVSSPFVNNKTSSSAVPDKTLLVPMRDERVRELVEEGLQLVAKSTQRKPSKLSRRENNGWSWIGKPVETITTKKGAIRKYYIGMRRKTETIFVRDNTTFRSGENDDVPYVGKILSFWQEKSEMMCSVYWYYQLEDENLLEDELMASQHVDHNPVAAINEKCYVLGLNGYCRYHAMLKRTIDNFASTKKPKQFVCKAKQSLYERLQTPDESVDPSLVYLCQKSYNYKTGKITGRK